MIFAQGKTRAQVIEIAQRICAGGHNLIVTRLGDSDGAALVESVPGARYSAQGRIAWRVKERKGRALGRVLVISAGTADQPVAEEAAVTEQLGNILQHFETLAGLDVSTVEPTAHVVDLLAAYREDVVTNPPAPEALRANAPARDDNFFKVPKIIE